MRDLLFEVGNLADNSNETDRDTLRDRALKFTLGSSDGTLGLSKGLLGIGSGK